MSKTTKSLTPDDVLIRKFVRMFKCDNARLSRFSHRVFLILGWERKTNDSKHTGCRWYKNGKPIHFTFTEEQVVASGSDIDELMASAREFKRLLQIAPSPKFAPRFSA